MRRPKRRYKVIQGEVIWISGSTTFVWEIGGSTDSSEDWGEGDLGGVSFSTDVGITRTCWSNGQVAWVRE